MAEIARSTYAFIDNLQYRLRAAGALLGVSDNTMRTYADASGLATRRANDNNPASPAVRVFDAATIFQLAAWRREQGLSKSPASSGPVTVCVDVIKGGTGKSTTTCELGVQLALAGLRVLLIDLDTQANLTQMLGYESDLTMDEAPAYELNQDAIVTGTFANVCIPFIERARGLSLRSGAEVEDVIKRPFGKFGPAIIPSDTYLADLEQALAAAKGQRELFFKKLIDEAKAGKVPGLDLREFDVIMFDCPPSLGFCSTNALAAADLVIGPIKLDSFSVKGLTKLMSELKALNAEYGVAPELVILPTHNAPNLARIGRMQTQLHVYKQLLAPSSISASEEFPKSLDNYLPLTLQKPTSAPAQEYRVFADYILSKILKIASDRAK